MSGEANESSQSRVGNTPKNGVQPSRTSLLERVAPQWRGASEAGKALYAGYRRLESSLGEVKAKPVPSEVVEAYERDRNVIESIYGQKKIRNDLLHHGTGSLQYTGKKYEEDTTRDEYRHPLDDILREGLKPHLDPWVVTMQDVVSTSFATTWPYAKWFADKHQNPHDPLKWEYGNSTDWFAYFMLDTFKTEATYALGRAVRNPRTVLKHLSSLPKQIVNTITSVRKSRTPVSSESLTKLQKWALDIRSDIVNTSNPVKILHGQTDIPNNHGAIITISKNDVELFDMGPGRVYEERTASQVSPDKFKSLAVPLNRVDEYKARVQERGLDITVLPIEAVEYHFSQFPLSQLTAELRAAPLKVSISK